MSNRKQMTVSCVWKSSVRQFLSTTLMERITSNENEIHLCTHAFLLKKKKVYSTLVSFAIKALIYD